MKRIYGLILIAVALLLAACTAGANPSNNTTADGDRVGAVTTNIATETATPIIALGTGTPALPAPVSSFVYPTPISTEEAVATLQAAREAIGTPTPITPEGKIEPDLAQAMEDNPQYVEFFAIISDQAPLTEADKIEPSHRGDSVYDALVDKAAHTQPVVEKELVELKTKGDVSSYKSYYIFNGFYIEGTARAVEAMSERSDIKTLELNHHYKREEVIRDEIVVTSTPDSSSIGQTSGILLWNIQLINAQAMWSRSITGAGITVGTVDSGVQYTHADLKQKFRGYNPSNPSSPVTDYSWYDTSGSSNRIPHDDVIGHGTRVMSVIVGPTYQLITGLLPMLSQSKLRCFSNQDEVLLPSPNYR